MLNDKDKEEMLKDANSRERREAFAKARQQSLKAMNWKEYLQFLQSVQHLFPQRNSPHKIQGSAFKL